MRTLRQAIVIRLPRSAWFGWCFGITGRRRGRHDGKVDLFDLEEVPLAGGFRQPFPPRAEDIAAVEIELVAQFVDRLLLFLDSLLVELRWLDRVRPGDLRPWLGGVQSWLGDPRPAERTGSAGRDIREDQWAMTVG